jgi:hypothetical protein
VACLALDLLNINHQSSNPINPKPAAVTAILTGIGVEFGESFR